MDEKLLVSLGLNAKEVKIFKAVLRAGEISPAQLAKGVGIKRTTCYHLARGLVEKGFLIENATKRPRTFSIAPASTIEGTLEDERKRLASREKMLKRFTAELSRTTAEDSYPVPMIRFIGEDKLEEFLLKQSLGAWDESMLKGDKTYWGFQDHTYVEQFPRVIEKYWKKTSKEISLKMLTNQSAAEVEKKLKWRYPRRQMKFWKGSGHFMTGIWIMGEYVVMLNTQRHPFYLVEIHDATLANDLREVFKSLWPLV